MSQENHRAPRGPMSAEESAYVRAVETAFLSLSGRGLMLSPLDEARALSWARSGIELETARRGIARAFEQLRQDEASAPRVPRLSFCERFVKQEHSRQQRLSLGAPRVVKDPDLEARREELCARLAEEGRQERDELVREAYRRAYRRLKELDADSELRDRVRRVDELLCDEIYQAAPAPLRAEIDQQVSVALARLPAAADPEVRDEFALASRRSELRRRLQIFRLQL